MIWQHLVGGKYSLQELENCCNPPPIFPKDCQWWLLRKIDFYMMAPTNISSLEVNINTNNTKITSVIIL